MFLQMTYKNLLPNYSSILEYEKRGGFAPKKLQQMQFGPELELLNSF
jgi:hypothetical protein